MSCRSGCVCVHEAHRAHCDVLSLRGSKPSPGTHGSELLSFVAQKYVANLSSSMPPVYPMLLETHKISHHYRGSAYLKGPFND
eukprot:6470730-Amphidinium_carterae.2